MLHITGYNSCKWNNWKKKLKSNVSLEKGKPNPKPQTRAVWAQGNP